MTLSNEPPPRSVPPHLRGLAPAMIPRTRRAAAMPAAMTNRPPGARPDFTNAKECLEMGEPATMTFLGVAPKVLAAACVGGAVSMVLGGGRWWERLTRGLAGPIVGVLLYPVGAKLLGWGLSRVVDDEWMPSPADLDVAAGIGIALVGIIACQALLNAGKAAIDDADDLVHSALKIRRRK